MRSAVAAVAVAALFVLAAGPGVSAQPTPHVRPDGHVVLAWMAGGSSEAYRAQAEQMPGVTVVSPTWWGLDGADPGGLVDDADPAFATWARDRGLAVWPLLGNRLDGDLTDAVLADRDRRARLVGATRAAVERAGVGGVVVGFENLHERTGPALTAFVAELQAALPDRVVAVTVAAQTETWSLGSWSAAYERRPLGEIADYVVLQALDQHSDALPGGPVAGLEWTLENIEHLLRTVPDHKIVLGVPLYARDWVEGPRAARGVALDATRGMAAMQRHLAAVGATHAFDPVAGQRHYTYTDAAGRIHHVWQEDPPSLGRRAELVTAYNLAGVAGWRSGLAGPQAWIAVSSALAADPRPPGPASGPPRLNRLIPLPRLAEPAPEAAQPDDTVGAGPFGPAGGRADWEAEPSSTTAPVITATALLAVMVIALGVWARLQAGGSLEFARARLGRPRAQRSAPHR